MSHPWNKIGTEMYWCKVCGSLKNTFVVVAYRYPLGHDGNNWSWTDLEPACMPNAIEADDWGYPKIVKLYKSYVNNESENYVYETLFWVAHLNKYLKQTGETNPTIEIAEEEAAAWCIKSNAGLYEVKDFPESLFDAYVFLRKKQLGVGDKCK
jgi:hypothetical protein